MAWASQFESPATDYQSVTLCLDDLLIESKTTIQLHYAQGNDLEARGIHDGDLLIVDIAADAQHNDIQVGW